MLGDGGFYHSSAQKIVGSTPSALSQGLTKDLPFYVSNNL